MSASLVALGEADGARLASAQAVSEPQAGDLHALQRLGAEHVAWPEDAIVLSGQARESLRTAAVRFVVRALSFWDHRTRARTLSAGKFFIDAAACLRIASLT